MAIPATVSQDQTDVEKVVLAGMKVMYDKNVFPKFIQGFEGAKGSLSDTLAAQAAGLIKILDDQSKGQIPKRVIVPAAALLLIEMVDFLVKSKLAQPSKADIADAIKKLTAIILKIYSTPQASAQPQGAAPAPGGAPTPPAPPAPPAAPPAGIVQAGMGAPQ